MQQEDNNQDSNAGASMAPITDGPAASPEIEPKIDDRGTDQSEALQILTSIRDRAFDSSNEKLALALGRPTGEVEDWIEGAGIIDGDVVQKARTLATERGFQRRRQRNDAHQPNWPYLNHLDHVAGLRSGGGIQL